MATHRLEPQTLQQSIRDKQSRFLCKDAQIDVIAVASLYRITGQLIDKRIVLDLAPHPGMDLTHDELATHALIILANHWHGKPLAPGTVPAGSSPAPKPLQTRAMARTA